MTVEIGEFDRRIEVLEATVTKDSAGDLLFNWEAPAQRFGRWAKKRDSFPSEIQAAQMTLRQVDTTFVLRWDTQSRLIAPENYRFMWRGTVYEIVGINEGRAHRMRTLEFTCSSRPDLVGSRGRLTGNEQP
jgi:head-tail adaptor